MRLSPSPATVARQSMLGVMLLLGGMALAEPAPPSPTRWVTDSVSLLSEGARTQLDARLQAYQRSTGHQLLVWIAASTGGVPVETYSVAAFKAWRVGQQGLDDGLVLFVFTGDRRTRIEVGYGLEGVVTDARAARILGEVVGPRLAAGDGDAAIIGAVDALLGLLGGEAGGQSVGSSSSPAPAQGRSLGVLQLILLGLLGLAFLVLLATHPQMALFLLASIASGGLGRRGGSGGVGFGGGGGRSGGGGASGSW